jgi:hypothetical protein
MERQGSERARRHHNELRFILDQRVNRTEQRAVQVMRHGKIKQIRILRVAGLAGNSLGSLGLKPAAKRGDLRLQGLSPECDGLPFITLPGEREDIALLGPY